MISFDSSILSLYLFTNSSAPEKATWLMYFLISSKSIPIPLSLKVRVLFSLSTLTITLWSSLRLASPILASLLCLAMASQPLLTNSLTNISLSEYNHFLIIGKIFSEWIDTLPFSVVILMPPLIFNYYYR